MPITDVRSNGEDLHIELPPQYRLPDSREAWRAALVDYFRAHRSGLSEDSVARLDRNPLRILDSKDPKDRALAVSAPPIDDFLTSEAADFFAQVTAGLDASGVRWKRSPMP